jgi:hypothetical protein
LRLSPENSNRCASNLVLPSIQVKHLYEEYKKGELVPNNINSIHQTLGNIENSGGDFKDFENREEIKIIT